MKYRYSLMLAILLPAFAYSSLAQTRMTGTVVELIDGKTVTVALPTGRVNVELQFIDVPEQDQPLYQTVRDHLRSLVIGKSVTFRLGGFVGSRMAGELNLNGVDIARQMVRDGAAWHIPRERSGQDPAGFSAYAEAEASAKNEKRGIWSIAGIKPPWVLREERAAERAKADEAEKQRIAEIEKAADKEFEARQKPKKAPLEVTRQVANDAWLDVTSNQEKQSYGLHPFSNTIEGVTAGVVSTSPEIVYLFSGTSRQKVACRAVYAEVETPEGKMDSIAILGFQAVSDTLNLTRNKNSLSIFADGQRIPVSGVVDVQKYEYFGVDERFAYSIKQRDFAKLANAQKVEVRIDNYKGNFAPKSLALFKELSNAMR